MLSSLTDSLVPLIDSSTVFSHPSEEQTLAILKPFLLFHLCTSPQLYKLQTCTSVKRAPTLSKVPKYPLRSKSLIQATNLQQPPSNLCNYALQWSLW